MSTLIFDKFFFSDEIISIPKDIILYRGMDYKPIKLIRDYPLYLSTFYIAENYGKFIYSLSSHRDLKLLDIRKIISLMPIIIRSRKFIDKESLECIKYLSIAFGLVSYKKQIELLKEHV